MVPCHGRVSALTSSSSTAKYFYEEGGCYAAAKAIGRLFRMEAREFDSRFNDVERQGERIARDIANDPLRAS